MAGMMKLLSPGASTTFNGTPWARAAAATSPVDLRVVVGGEHQGGARDVGGDEAAPLQNERVLVRQSDDPLGKLLGHDADARRRLGEEPKLLQRLLAAADDQDVAAVEVDENREVPQRLTLLRALT